MGYKNDRIFESDKYNNDGMLKEEEIDPQVQMDKKNEIY